MATTQARKTPAKKTAAAPARKVTVARRSASVKPSVKTKNDTNVEHKAYIPDPSLAHKYVHRAIWGVRDFSLFDRAMQAKENILLMGDTGSGKTMAPAAYASEKRIMYYSVPCDVAIDTTALFGKMVPTDQPGKFEWVDGPVTEMVRNGGVLNISEINFMPPKIAASLYPLLDGRRYLSLLGHKGEVINAHDGLLIVADMNPNYRGTHDLNAAFLNRFAHKVPWGYDDTVEQSLVKFPTLRDIGKKLRAMHGTELTTPTSTNMLMEFEAFVVVPELGVDYAIGNFVSGFRGEERNAVENVFKLNKSALLKDIAFAQGQTEGEDEFEDISDYGTYEVEA